MSARVSVITTVRNEAGSIAALLDSLARQSRPPDEIVLTDGGSTDDTVRIASGFRERGLPLRIIAAPGANISRGRNLAIAAADGPIIASVDAGVRLQGDWLERLTSPWAADGPSDGPDVAAGFFEPDAHGLFEIVMGATVLPEVQDADPASFLPSSRSVAFTKAAWQQAGGYPEWLDYCEDLVFDFRLKARGCRFVFVPDAVARFRPRASLRAFFIQYFRYARGDGKADLWRLRHAIRYVTYLVGLPVLLGLTAWVSPWWLVVLAAGAVAYCRRPVTRSLRRTSGRPAWERLAGIALAPLIRVTGDVAKIIGYPVGLWWRWQHRGDAAIHWRGPVA